MKPAQAVLDAGGVRVTVLYKRMKNIRLRVLPSGEAVLSAPFGTGRRVVEDFVRSKRAWLVQSAARARENAPPERGVYDGARRVILGREVALCVKTGAKKRVTFQNGVVTLETNDKDAQAWRAQYDAWLKKEALSYFERVTDELYPLVQPYGAARPRLYVRRMSTRWGSCTPRTASIRLNLELFEAEKACIEAVILHELTHLLYPDHGSAFYAFLHANMPDYDARRKTLQRTVRL